MTVYLRDGKLTREHVKPGTSSPFKSRQTAATGAVQKLIALEGLFTMTAMLSMVLSAWALGDLLLVTGARITCRIRAVVYCRCAVLYAGDSRYAP